MNRRELGRVARGVVQDLELARPLDVSLLIERLAQQRGRPIELVATDALPPNSAFGFTGGDETIDVIMYEKRTARAHQTLIVLHELAHMILDHPRHAVDHGLASLRAEEFQTISADALAEVLGQGARQRRRTGFGRWRKQVPSLYDDRNEWEAEVLATILFSWTPACGQLHSEPRTDPFEALLSGSSW